MEFERILIALPRDKKSLGFGKSPKRQEIQYVAERKSVFAIPYVIRERERERVG
jgi:hypothetical protein